jgi:CHRD domain
MVSVAIQRRNNSVTLFRFTETDGELSGRDTIMKTKNIGFWAIAAVMANLLAAPVANSQTERFSASLSGAEEVPPINTAGTGAFEMTIQQGTITFSLTFSDLSSPLSVAHLHFAPSKVAGGVMIFLCGGGGQPACPATTEGTITGTITAANVTGPSAQGIAPGDLDSALEAVRNDGLAYVNMHTANFGGGEIRGQVRRGAGHGRGPWVTHETTKRGSPHAKLIRALTIT